MSYNSPFFLPPFLNPFSTQNNGLVPSPPSSSASLFLAADGSWGVPAGTGVSSITGTSNQVIASSPTGDVILSLPQSIATTSDVSFGSLLLTTGNLRATYAAPSSDVGAFFTNTSNSADSRAIVQINSGGASAADSVLQFTNLGIRNWTMGLDNSTTNDDFVISKSIALGTTDVLAIDGSSNAIKTGIWTATVIGLLYGGLNAALAASNGGIFYSTATAGAILSGTATANQILMSGSSAAPAWSTATYPSTTTINQILYSSSANTIAGLATANSSTLITDGSGVPSLSQTLPSTVQGNITSVGTIASGTWQGTNIALNKGGTNASLTASNGGIFYSTGSAGAILSGTATARQMLQSGASTTPAWSTSTWPATTTINQILYSSAANTISEITTANNGVLITSSGGVPSISSTLPTAVQDNITRLGTIANIGAALGVTFGGTGTATQFTSGSVIFAGTNGIYSQNNAQFNWNNSTNILTVIGKAAFGQSLASENYLFHSINGDNLLRIQAPTSAENATPGSAILSIKSTTDWRFNSDISSGNLILSNSTIPLIHVNTTGHVGYNIVPISTIGIYNAINITGTSGNVFNTAIIGQLGASSGTVNAFHLYVDPQHDNNVSTITDAIGVFINQGTNAGTITNGYNFRVVAPAYGTNKYTAYFDAGVGIGVPTANGTGSVFAINANSSNQYFVDWRGNNTSSTGTCIGFNFGPTLAPTAAVSSAAAMEIYTQLNASAGAITTAYGLKIDNGAFTTTAATKGIGLRVDVPAFGTSNICAAFNGGITVGSTSILTIPPTNGMIIDGDLVIGSSSASGKLYLFKSASGQECLLNIESGSNTVGANAKLALTSAGTNADPYIAVTNNSAAASFGIDSSDSSKFKLSLSSSLGSSDAIVCTTAGEITYPLQPAFLTTRSADVSNVTGDNTNYTCAFDTEIYDQNSDYNNSTFTFTAPVTGRYHFSATVGIANIGASHASGYCMLVASNRNFLGTYNSPASVRTNSNGSTYLFNDYMDMDAADTCTVRLNVSGSTKTITFDSSSGQNSNFGGKLVA